MYVIETRIKTRSNKTIWMPYKQYRTTNGIENFQKRHQYLFDAGELRVTGNAEPRQSHTKSGKGLLRVGDILHESYGYDMTINKFYEVIALSPSGKTCTIQPIHKITIKGDAYSPYGSEVVPQTEGEDRFCGEPIKGKRIQIGAYAKSRVYVRISSYSSAYKMSEEDFEQPYYENHMN